MLALLLFILTYCSQTLWNKCISPWVTKLTHFFRDINWLIGSIESIHFLLTKRFSRENDVLNKMSFGRKSQGLQTGWSKLFHSFLDLFLDLSFNFLLLSLFLLFSCTHHTHTLTLTLTLTLSLSLTLSSLSASQRLSYSLAHTTHTPAHSHTHSLTLSSLSASQRLSQLMLNWLWHRNWGWNSPPPPPEIRCQGLCLPNENRWKSCWHHPLFSSHTPPGSWS